jgi:hypothetical protein
MADFELIVVTDFGEYVRGERIRDQVKIVDIVNSDQAQFVTHVQVEDEPQ